MTPPLSEAEVDELVRELVGHYGEGPLCPSATQWRRVLTGGDEPTAVDVARSMFTYGTPDSVLDQLVAFREEVGLFGTLVSVAHDWDRPEMWTRSMQLLAEDVMPRFAQHCEAVEAAD